MLWQWAQGTAPDAVDSAARAAGTPAALAPAMARIAVTARLDIASRIITEVVTDPERHGRIYHLTDPAPMTNDDVKQHLEAYFRMHGGYFVDPDDGTDQPSLAESLLWEKYDVVTRRATHTPRFDQANTREVMQATGVGFPSIDRDRFFTLLDYAVARNWGQRANGKRT